MSADTGEAGDLPYGVAPPGYRLPAKARLGRVRLQIADLDRSITWYQEVLGFRLREREGVEASLAATEGGPTLIELVERPGSTPVPRRGRLGLYHFAILLPDRAALGRFVANLAQVGVRSGASDHLVSEALYLQDPDGLGIEVYADRPRPTWRFRDRQLLMATEPLDLQSLVRAAAGEAWTGMPADTVIGHVHLHVGDIAEAERFYHRGVGLDRVVWSYPGALFLSAGGYHHHLGVNTWAAGAKPAGEQDSRLLEWEILLPSVQDARSALESVAGEGFEVERDRSGGVVRDPWGTALAIRTSASA